MTRIQVYEEQRQYYYHCGDPEDLNRIERKHKIKKGQGHVDRLYSREGDPKEETRRVIDGKGRDRIRIGGIRPIMEVSAHRNLYEGKAKEQRGKRGRPGVNR